MTPPAISPEVEAGRQRLREQLAKGLLRLDMPPSDQGETRNQEGTKQGGKIILDMPIVFGDYPQKLSKEQAKELVTSFVERAIATYGSKGLRFAGATIAADLWCVIVYFSIVASPHSPAINQTLVEMWRKTAWPGHC